jgi:hypothetical protein
LRVCVGENAASSGPNSSPFSSAGVSARVRAARLRGLSRRMAWTRSHVSRSMIASCSPGIAFALVDRLADIGAVVQHPVEVLLVDPVAARCADTALGHLARQFGCRADLQEPGEDPADYFGGFFVHHQLAVLDAIAVGRHPAHPHALAPRGRDLVADAFSRDLAFELGEREQDVQRQPAHGRGGVEGLRDGDEGHAVPIEHLDQLGEVGERAAEAVDLVDHHHVDQPILDVLQQPLQAGPLQRAARDAAVVIRIANQHPAL